MNVLRKVGSDTGNLSDARDVSQQYWQNPRLQRGLEKLLKSKISAEMANFNSVCTRIVSTNRHTGIGKLRGPIRLSQRPQLWGTERQLIFVFFFK